MGEQPQKYAKIAGVLEGIAKKKGGETLITSIALAYVMHKAPYVFPIVGGRKVSHLKGNIDALSVKLTDEEINEIDRAEPFDIGYVATKTSETHETHANGFYPHRFPQNFIFGYGGKKYKTDMTAKDIQLVAANSRIETVPKVKVSCPFSKIGCDERLLTAPSSIADRARPGACIL